MPPEANSPLIEVGCQMVCNSYHVEAKENRHVSGIGMPPLHRPLKDILSHPGMTLGVDKFCSWRLDTLRSMGLRCQFSCNIFPLSFKYNNPPSIRTRLFSDIRRKKGYWWLASTSVAFFVRQLRWTFNEPACRVHSYPFRRVLAEGMQASKSCQPEDN